MVSLLAIMLIPRSLILPASERFIAENALGSVRRHLPATSFLFGYVLVVILSFTSLPELVPSLCWIFGIHQIASEQEDVLFLLRSDSEPFDLLIIRTKRGKRFKLFEKAMMLQQSTNHY